MVPAGRTQVAHIISVASLHLYWVLLVVVYVRSTMFDVDEKRDEWQEEIYENQARYPLSSWPDESKSYWNNVVCCIQYYCIWNTL